MLTETERLVITELTMDMAPDVQANSLDEDNRRFVPDEVFETPEEAREAVAYLAGQYGNMTGPQVYAVLTRADGRNIGHVQMVPIGDGAWEIGYHIASRYTGKGYATEAVRAFLPVMAERIGIREVRGICLAENAASRRVLEKCGFTLQFAGTGAYQGENREISRYRIAVPGSRKAEPGGADSGTENPPEPCPVVIRATETWQQAGAYYVRIQAMARKHHITLRQEFDEHDTPETKYIVVTDRDFPVATARMYPLNDTDMMIGRVVVLPEYRHRGIGTATVLACEEWAAEMGYRKAVVESRDNKTAFYEQLGYETCGEPADGTTFRCVRMEKAVGLTE